MKQVPTSKPRAARSYPSLGWLAAATVLASLAHATPAQADERKQALTLMVNTYWDGANDARSRAIGDLPTENEDLDVERGPAFGLSVGYLRTLASSVRAGGTFRYLSVYRFKLEDDEDDVGDQELGEYLEVVGNLEYAIDMADKLDVILGVEMGLAMILAGGELDDELNTLEEQGYNIWGMPRLGLVAGPELAVAYELNEWLSARAGVALLYTKLFLYDASTDDDVGEASRTFTLTRLRTAVGLEARF